MRAIYLLSALAASSLTGLAANAHAAARTDLACGSGYHPEGGGNCEPDVAETNRYCPTGQVYHPWINGGWYCETPEPSAASVPVSYPAETHRYVAPRVRQHPRVASRPSAPRRSLGEARTLPAPTQAPAVAIAPTFSAPPIMHGASGGSGSGGAGGWSDRRLKRDIVRLGVSPSGLPIYAFQYVWGGPRFIGVMAQDLLKLRPDAVILDESGFYKVDYSRIDVEMREELLVE